VRRSHCAATSLARSSLNSPRPNSRRRRRTEWVAGKIRRQRHASRRSQSPQVQRRDRARNLLAKDSSMVVASVDWPRTRRRPRWSQRVMHGETSSERSSLHEQSGSKWHPNRADLGSVGQSTTEPRRDSIPGRSRGRLPLPLVGRPVRFTQDNKQHERRRRDADGRPDDSLTDRLSLAGCAATYWRGFSPSKLCYVIR
jgi:hypothetical protein